MTDYHLVSQIPPEQWDRFVESHNASPYLRYGWGQAVTQAYGHPHHYFACCDPDQNVKAVLPAIEFRRPLLGNQLISLPFCDIGGVVADNADAEVALLNHVNDWAKQRGLGSQRRCAGDKLDTPEQQRPQKVSMKLTLPGSSDALLTSFKSKLRSQIRKAGKNGLSAELIEQPSEADMAAFYQVMALNMRSLGSPVHSKKWFSSVVQFFQGQLCLGLVYYQQRVVGAGLVLKNGTQASIPWASTVAQYNRLAPNMLLYWSLLAHCADNGIECFDFGRSTLNEGTYKFKKQWGAEPYKLHWQASGINDGQEPVRAVSSGRLKNTVINLWSSLPLSVTNRIGPRLRRYISL